MNSKDMAVRIFQEALRSVDPEDVVKGYTEQILSYYSMKNFSRLMVAGFGKASYQMAAAIEEAIDPGMISGGIIVTKYGHTQSRRTGGLKRITVYEAGHPIPDANGTRSTEEIIRMLESADEKTLVLCLVSGGGSALLVSPHEEITLEEKQDITDLLLKAGADITELNSVRKHLSRVKGGRLAEIIYPAETISLMISDVVGDRLDVIASGPTAPDTSTFADALEVVRKYGLGEKAPGNVMSVLTKGRQGMLPETPKQDDRIFGGVQNTIISNNIKAIESARNEAVFMGLETEILTAEITGEAKEAGKWLAKKALEIKKSGVPGNKGSICLLSGGETTVKVKGKGKGGRNTELALSFAVEIDGADGITMLSAGTDGTDGPTDAAGAVVDGETVKKAAALGLNPGEYLENNDSYNFFKALDSLVITGPTGTNVMDVQIILVEF